MKERCRYFVAEQKGKIPKAPLCGATGKILFDGRTQCPFSRYTNEECFTDEPSKIVYVAQIALPREEPQSVSMERKI